MHQLSCPPNRFSMEPRLSPLGRQPTVAQSQLHQGNCVGLAVAHPRLCPEAAQCKAAGAPGMPYWTRGLPSYAIAPFLTVDHTPILKACLWLHSVWSCVIAEQLGSSTSMSIGSHMASSLLSGAIQAAVTYIKQVDNAG